MGICGPIEICVPWFCDGFSENSGSYWLIMKFCPWVSNLQNYFFQLVAMILFGKKLFPEKIITGIQWKHIKTRMHSSRMRTACSLTISCRILCMPPWAKTMHTPQQKPCMPLAKTTHAPLQKPCMLPQQKPCMLPLAKTMHAPQQKPHMPPPRSNHACPLEQPHMPPRPPPTPTVSNHARPPPVNRITDACENITFANYVCGR